MGHAMLKDIMPYFGLGDRHTATTKYGVDHSLGRASPPSYLLASSIVTYPFGIGLIHQSFHMLDDFIGSGNTEDREDKFNGYRRCSPCRYPFDLVVVDLGHSFQVRVS